MSVKNHLFALCFLSISSGCSSLLTKAAREIKKQDHGLHQMDSFYTNLSEKKQPLIIGFSGRNISTATSDVLHYAVFFSTSGSATAYRYFAPRVHSLNGSWGKRLDSLNVTKDAAKAILLLFRDTEKWDMNYDDVNNPIAEEYCFEKTKKPCHITHGTSYKVDLIYKKYRAISYLFTPEDFETKCCSGNINRQKFLAIKSVIENAFKEMPLK